MSDLKTIMREIRTERGALTPAIVLDEARKPEHPLHSYAAFKWDDDESAADAYRLGVARDLIRSVRISYTTSSGQKAEQRMYRAVRLNPELEYDYEPVEDLMADPIKRKLLLNDMKRQIGELVAQYEAVQEFWAEIRKLARRKAS